MTPSETTDDLASQSAPPAPSAAPGNDETAYAWCRLGAALALMTVGSVGMYAVVVALPAIQSEFAVGRSGASLPYTMIMIGWGVGGIIMGRLVDRFGVMVPVIIGALALGLGFALAAASQSLWQFALVHGILIGLLGISATFAPLLADISQWFSRHRGIAIAICASGSYLAGALWPPLLQRSIAEDGWRQTYVHLGFLCVATMLPLALVLRPRPPRTALAATSATAGEMTTPLGLAPRTLQRLLCVAGVGCCVAMSMPQVHIVSLCHDLGFHATHGAEMLSLMLGCGVVSRLVFGGIADRLGGLRTLLLGSSLQCLALVCFLPARGMVELYVVSALFGLFQGGIVPSYAIVVREYYPATEVGARVGTVIMATLMGMALGGWMSGVIFDSTGSYTPAFVNGIGWNLLNLGVVIFLLRRRASHARHRGAPAGGQRRPAPALCDDQAVGRFATSDALDR